MNSCINGCYSTFLVGTIERHLVQIDRGYSKYIGGYIETAGLRLYFYSRWKLELRAGKSAKINQTFPSRLSLFACTVTERKRLQIESRYNRTYNPRRSVRKPSHIGDNNRVLQHSKNPHPMDLFAILSRCPFDILRNNAVKGRRSDPVRHCTRTNSTISKIRLPLESRRDRG